MIAQKNSSKLKHTQPMIVRLKGILLEKQAQGATIDVHGLGYYVFISTQTLSELPAAGKEVTLKIYHHFTDQGQSLFGFEEKKEQDMFEMLITVKGIGPKVALGVLSGMPIDQLVEAIAHQDIKRLTNIPGIGKRTAERLCVELKDKVQKQIGTTGSPATQKAPGGKNAVLAEDATSALQALGYKEPDARKAVQATLSEKDNFKDTSALIKDALVRLNS
jgi:Holliday junction DNA helicase RuvA